MADVSSETRLIAVGNPTGRAPWIDKVVMSRE
jgi:hypothetical protein